MPISIDPNENGVTETETKGYLSLTMLPSPILVRQRVQSFIIFPLRLSRAETIAFIGSTGSGKSSLVQLIPRFYDVTLGKILVDGVDVRDFNVKSPSPKDLASSHRRPYSSRGLLPKTFVTEKKMPVLRS